MREFEGTCFLAAMRSSRSPGEEHIGESGGLEAL